MINPKLASFSSDIYAMIKEKDLDFIDAVVHWCELNRVEIELAASLVKGDPNLMFEIQVDAESLNYLKKTSRLPV